MDQMRHHDHEAADQHAGHMISDSHVVCPRCGSEEVEQRWFYRVTAKWSA